MWDLIVLVPDHCLSFYFLIGIHGINRKTLLNVLICYSKALQNLMQSDMPLRQWSGTRKDTVIITIQTEEL